MENAEYIDRRRLRRGTDPIEQQVPALSTLPRDMKRHDPFAEVIAYPGSGNARAGLQSVGRATQRFGVDPRLRCSEMGLGPSEYVAGVIVGGGRQTNFP